MTLERIFAQFRIENPQCESHLDPLPHEYGLPLSPSGTYSFFEWAAQTGRIPAHKAEPLCEALLARFGEAVRHGRIGAWDQPKSDWK
jgi:hypothetical protein